MKTTAELLAEKRAEVAALEKKILSEVDGNFAIVKKLGDYGDIGTGAIVKLSHSESEDFPIQGDLLDGSDWDVYALGDIEVITIEQARAHLIAEIDRQLGIDTEGA